MLFYAKTSNDYFFRQTLTAPELWPHLVKIQETLLVNNRSAKIRSSTGIRESIRIQTFNSIGNNPQDNSNNKKSIDTNKKSIDRVIERLEKQQPRQKINNASPGKMQVSKSSEGILKKSSNFINNYIDDSDNHYREGKGSEKELRKIDEDVFFERIDNLADKKLQMLDRRKKDRGISIIEEEKGNESTVVQQTESEVLKGRMHVEFIYKEEENAGHTKKIEIVKTN